VTVSLLARLLDENTSSQLELHEASNGYTAIYKQQWVFELDIVFSIPAHYRHYRHHKKISIIVAGLLRKFFSTQAFGHPIQQTS